MTNSHGERRKASILQIGLQHWPDVSARRIAGALGMTHSAVLYHFKDIAGLRAAIAAEAVRVGDPLIVPMLIAARHPAVASMGAEQRQKYLAGC